MAPLPFLKPTVPEPQATMARAIQLVSERHADPAVHRDIMAAMKRADVGPQEEKLERLVLTLVSLIHTLGHLDADRTAAEFLEGLTDTMEVTDSLEDLAASVHAKLTEDVPADDRAWALVQEEDTRELVLSGPWGERRALLGGMPRTEEQKFLDTLRALDRSQ